ncbi:hypothetical protein CM5_01855 [Mycoplasmoides genitalium M2288]|uniref:MPN449 family protein n=1 Tax=Mycoplasmoides genitalium TaxID=2097 RepID=UPI00027B3C05|nr:hypothetical protein [Mycoplasmoides genitalium]AFQ04643.1 hypothetical protein CM5_01855 [Mycoplasmoides genitalium M2288]
MTFSEILTKVQNNLDIVFNNETLRTRIKTDSDFAKTILAQLKLLYFLEEKQKRVKTKKPDHFLFGSFHDKFIQLGQNQLSEKELKAAKFDLTDALDLANYLNVAVKNLFNKELNSFTKLAETQVKPVSELQENNKTVKDNPSFQTINNSQQLNSGLENNILQQTLQVRARDRAFGRFTSEKLVGKIFEFQFKSQWIKWAQLAIFISMIAIFFISIAYVVMVNVFFTHFVDKNSPLFNVNNDQNTVQQSNADTTNLNRFFALSSSNLITMIFLAFGGASFFFAFQGKPYSFATRGQTNRAMRYLRSEFGVKEFPKINDNYRYKVRIKWIFWTIFIFVFLNCIPGNIVRSGFWNAALIIRLFSENQLISVSPLFASYLIGIAWLFVFSIVPFSIISVITFSLSPKLNLEQTNEIFNKYFQEELAKPITSDESKTTLDIPPPTIFG